MITMAEKIARNSLYGRVLNVKITISMEESPNAQYPHRVCFNPDSRFSFAPIMIQRDVLPWIEENIEGNWMQDRVSIDFAQKEDQLFTFMRFK